MKGFLSGFVFALVLVGALYLAPGVSLVERWWWLAAGRDEYPVYDPATREVAVLLTGTSSGIGRHAALALASRGYHVFATVRRERDAASLTEEAGPAATLHPILCDVTEPDQVVRARDTVAAWLQETSASDDPDHHHPPRVLAGVINNAGINSDFQLLEHASIDGAVQRVWEVNVLAPLRVYQAFAPLLHRHSARLIAVGSLAGQVARTFRGPYTVSKFALEGLVDTVRQELYFDPVAVILINPGYVKTDIGKKSAEAHRRNKKQTASLTDQQQAMLEGFETSYHRAFATADGPADSTTPAILRALADPRPRTRYYPGVAGGMPAWFIPKLKQLMPDRVLDAFMIRVIQKIRAVE